MDKVKIAISNSLKTYRKEKGLTQEGLGYYLRESEPYSSKTIAQWEQCKANPPIDVLIRMRNELGISLDEIFGLKPIENVMTTDKLIQKWTKEYVHDQSLIFQLEVDSIYDECDPDTKLRSDIQIFFNGQDLPIEINPSNNKIDLNPNHLNENLINFFLRKKLISYYKIYNEYTDSFDKNNFHVSPLLAKTLADKNIRYLKEQKFTKENIKTNQELTNDQIKEICDKINNQIYQNLHKAEKILKVIEEIEKNDQ